MVKRAPLNLPPAVALAFVEDMRAYFAEENRYKQDEIALRQLSALNEYRGLRKSRSGFPTSR